MTLAGLIFLLACAFAFGVFVGLLSARDAGGTVVVLGAGEVALVLSAEAKKDAQGKARE